MRSYIMSWPLCPANGRQTSPWEVEGLILKCISIYTMHNKFSNCFSWVSPSTPDLKIHFIALGYERRSPDNNFHVKIYRIFERRSCANMTLDFETSVQSGYL